MSGASIAGPLGRHHADAMENPIPVRELLRAKGWPTPETAEAAALKHWVAAIDAFVQAAAPLMATPEHAPAVTR